MLHHGQPSDRSPVAVGSVACRGLESTRLSCLAGPWISSASGSTGGGSTTARRLVVAAARSRTRTKKQPSPDAEDDGTISGQGYGADQLPITDAEVEGVADADRLGPITDAEVEGIGAPGDAGLRWDDEDGGAGAGGAGAFEDDDDEDRLRERPRSRANRRGRPSKADMLAQEEAATRAGAGGGEAGGYGVGVGPEIEEAIRTYDSMYEEDVVLPYEMVPEDDEQEARLRFGLACEAYLVRKETREKFTDYGFQAQSEQARRSYNKYANVHAVAALVTEIENVDHAMGQRGYHYLNSWGRAEVLFMRDYFDDFNEYVRENAKNLVKQWPHEEQEEEFDMVDEAVLLPDFSDTRSAAPGDADVEAELAASCLARMLPGLDLDTLSQGDLADDIFSDAAIDFDGLDENDVVAMQDKEEGKDVEGEGTGAAATAGGKRGRKKATDTASEEGGDIEE